MTSVSIVTPKLWRYTKTMFTCGNICHSHPYQWNEGLQRGEMCPSKRQLVVWYLNVGLTIFYTLYLVTRGLQIHVDPESSNVQKVYIKFILFFFAFPVLFQTCLVMKKEDLASFYPLNKTAIRTFEEQLSEHEAKKGPKVAEQEIGDRTQRCMMPKLADLFFDYLWYGFSSVYLIQGPLNCVRPQSPEFMSSWLAPDSGPLRWPLILFSTLFQMYYTFTYISNAFFFVYVGFSCTIPVLIVLVQIKEWFTVGSDTIPGVTAQRILDTYRIVRIIMRAYEIYFCDLLFPASKGIIVGLCVFCAYGAIKMEGVLAVFLGAIGILVAGVLIPLLSIIARFDSYSTEILKLMKEPRFQASLTLDQKKEVKSLVPIQLRMRRAYIVDKECVKTVYQIIVDSTADMLLAQA